MKDYLQKTIGIIGGGQLGKMMALEAKKMGLSIMILDPSASCPAHSLSDRHIVAAFDDEAAIAGLSELCDVITYEFEHIGAEVLLRLEQAGKKVYPTAESLRVIQNKLTQKTVLEQAGIPVPPFMAVESPQDAARAGEIYGYPFILKNCTGGYDGKGNYCLESGFDIDNAYKALGGGRHPLMAERFVRFSMEVSALACRGINGETAVFPIAENHHQDNILVETRVPARIGAETTEQAIALARRVMDVFDGVGMFCVEMFVTDRGVMVNEVAPRPHNSGHYTIEACYTSQFEQHIRAVAGLPLGSPGLLCPAAMRNLLGEDGHSGKAAVTGAAKCLEIPGVSLHIYGKEQTRPKRKMGHITALGKTPEEACEKAKRAWDAVKIISNGAD